MEDYVEISIDILLCIIIGLISGFVIATGIFFFRMSPVFAVIVGTAIGSEVWFFINNFDKQAKIEKVRVLLCLDRNRIENEFILENVVHLRESLKQRVVHAFKPGSSENLTDLLEDLKKERCYLRILSLLNVVIFIISVRLFIPLTFLSFRVLHSYFLSPWMC